MLNVYNQLIESGQMRKDAAQAGLVAKLDELEKDIVEYSKDRNSIKSRYLGIKGKAPKGMYVHGKVGRGKSMIVDLFYEKLEMKTKRRMHFHEFMKKVHDEIHLFRGHGVDDPVEQVAHEMASKATLFCFDEYEVNDVTDAMILSKLFGHMMEEGVVLMFTSNRMPQDHYKSGLQRQTYIDFCKELESQVELFSLDSEIDYRMLRSDDNKVENYFSPLSYDSTRKLKRRYKELGGESLENTSIEVKGRLLPLKSSGRILWVSFMELCGQPLGSQDYLEVAKNFDVVVMESIPQMKSEMRNEARRFVSLIDILYENKTKFLCTADAEPMELYTSGSGDFEFKRTASRLTEMRNLV